MVEAKKLTVWLRWQKKKLRRRAKMSGTEREKLTGQRKGLKSQLRLRGTEKEIDHEGPRKGQSRKLLLQLRLRVPKENLNGQERARAKGSSRSFTSARYPKRSWKAKKGPAWAKASSRSFDCKGLKLWELERPRKGQSKRLYQVVAALSAGKVWPAEKKKQKKRKGFGLMSTAQCGEHQANWRPWNVTLSWQSPWWATGEAQVCELWRCSNRRRERTGEKLWHWWERWENTDSYKSQTPALNAQSIMSQPTCCGKFLHTASP